MSKVSSVMLLLKGPSESFCKTSTISFFLFGQYIAGTIILYFNVVSYFQSGDVLLLESKWPIIG